VLWSEPQGTVVSTATDVTRFTLGETKFGEKVHSSIRRFIIVATSKGHSTCMFVSATLLVRLYANDYSPILTYNHKGTLAPGINRDSHAIVYTNPPGPERLRGEPKFLRSPIEIIPKTPRDRLGPDSRINYTKIYTVEHNVKVMFIGHVAPASVHKFMNDYNDTWRTNLRPDPFGYEP
jgi:hypothetical protein